MPVGRVDTGNSVTTALRCGCLVQHPRPVGPARLGERRLRRTLAPGLRAPASAVDDDLLSVNNAYSVLCGGILTV
jgi:hypothetical protein